MNAHRFLSGSVCVALAVALAGCASMKSETSVSVLEGIYSSPKDNAITGDIKKILVAGGLDPNSPSVPTSETKPKEVANTDPNSHPKLKQLVASLESTPPASTAIPGVAASAAPSSAFASTKADDPVSAALALVEIEEKAVKPAKPRVAVPEQKVASVTITYPEIGAAARQEVEESVSAKEQTSPAKKNARARKAPAIVPTASADAQSRHKPRRF